MQQDASCPAQGISKALSVTLVLYFGSLLHAIVTKWQDLGRLDAFEAGELAAFEATGTTFTGMLGLGTGIIMLVFVARLARTAHALGAKNLAFTPSRAVWSYIIPFVSFYRPYLAMREVWQVSSPNSSDSNWHESKHYGLVKLWWAVTTLAIFVGVGFAAVNFEAFEKTDAASVRTLLQSDVISHAFSLVSTVVLLTLTKSLSRRFQAKWEKRFGPASVPAAKVA